MNVNHHCLLLFSYGTFVLSIIYTFVNSFKYIPHASGIVLGNVDANWDKVPHSPPRGLLTQVRAPERHSDAKQTET